MKNLVIAIAAAVIVLSACSGSHTGDRLPAEELKLLDKAISHAGEYAERYNEEVDSLKSLTETAGSATQRVKALVRIADKYRQNMADSSLLYANLALQEALPTADADNVDLARLAVCNALVASGFFTQAIERYDSLRPESMNHELKIRYFLVGRRLYSNMRNYVDERGYMSSFYESRYVECDDSLISLLPEQSDFRQFIIGEKLVASGKFSSARHLLENLLDKLDPRDNIYGMTAYQLAIVYKGEGDLYSYAAYLAKAARADIMQNVREGYALPALASWLYDKQEFALAFRYINFALGDAFRSNARASMVSMARLVPKIDEAYRVHISRSRSEWLAYGIFISILLVALGIVTFFLLKQIKKSKAAQQALASTSRLKDSYIGNFIGLCSTYSEKYHSLTRLVDRKLSSGQGQELLKAIHSGKFGEDGNENFYKEIDSVVLSLYPDFVDKINSLLRPEERIEIKGGMLTPELRIYAFVRLGVSESVKIATILNYSSNTVYAYRNRMRNRAIDRDKFDENVLKIGLE